MSGQHRLSSLLAFFFSLCVSFTTASAVDLDPSTHQAIPGDFNGDGRIDALLQPLTDSVGGALLLQDGTGNLSVVAQGWDPGYLGLDWSAGKSAITTADLNGDGLADVVIQPREAGKNAAVLITDPTVQLLQVAQVIPANYLGLDWSTAGHLLVAGDFDGDRQKELLLQAAAPGVPSAIVHADISGHLMAVTQAIPDGYLNRRWDAEDVTLYVGDFNGDGRQDLLIQVNAGHEKAGESSYALLLAAPNGRFTQVSEVWNDSDFGGDWSPATHTLSLQDVNGDGITDIVLTSKNGGTNYLFEPNAQGQITQPTVKWTGNKSASDALKQQAGTKNANTGISVVVAKPAATQAATNTATMQTAQVMAMAQTLGNAPKTPNAVGVSDGQGGASGGNANYSISIVVPPGIKGMQPSLALSYSSRGGNGEVGMGWSISGQSSIRRCPETVAEDGQALGVSYSANTDRLCLDGQRLMAWNGVYGADGTTYRTELDTFALITEHGAINSGTSNFEVDYKDGRRAFYGYNSNTSQTTNPMLFAQTPGSSSSLSTPLIWAEGSETDRDGNNIVYTYLNTANKGEMHLSSVSYTGASSTTPPYAVTAVGNRVVQFNYSARTDISQTIMAGGETNQTQVLTDVAVSVGGTEVRDYSLSYGQSGATNRSLLQSVQECGYAADGSQQCLPASTFTWQNNAETFSLLPTNQTDQYDFATLGGDFAGNGRRSVVYYSGTSTATIVLFNPDGSTLATVNGSTLFDQLDGTNASTLDVDMNHDGVSDLVGVYQGQVAVSSWNGSAFSTPVKTGVTVSSAYNIADVNGDGYPDIVAMVPNGSGGYTLDAYLNVDPKNLSFGAPIKIDDMPAAPSSYQVTGDLTGNGMPVILVSAGNNIVDIAVPKLTNGTPSYTVVHPTDAGIGITTALQQDQHFFLDINGDGLPDFVYSDGNNWYYMLNLGQSTSQSINFAAPVNAGVDSRTHTFNTMQADIDNDGVQELIYPANRIDAFCPLVPAGVDNNNTHQSVNACFGGSKYSGVTVPESEDYSIYSYNAIKFVLQTSGPNQGRYQAVYNQNTGIVAQAQLAQTGDLLGNGLTQVFSPFSAWFSGAMFSNDGGNTLSACPPDYWCGFRVSNNVNATGYYPNAAPDMMQGAVNSLGVSYHWDYYPLTTPNPGFYYAPPVGSPNRYADNNSGSNNTYVSNGLNDYIYFTSSMYVVGDFEVSNGVSGVNTHDFKYSQAIYNTRGRGFQGFYGVVDEFYPANGDASDQIRTIQLYHQRFPLSGQLMESWTEPMSESLDITNLHLPSDGDYFEHVSNTPACNVGQGAPWTSSTGYNVDGITCVQDMDAHAYWPYVSSSEVVKNGADYVQISDTKTSMSYDSLGYYTGGSSNTIDASTPSTTGYTTNTTISYSPADVSATWDLELVQSKTVSSQTNYVTPIVAAANGTMSRTVNYDYYSDNSLKVKDEYDDQGTAFEKDIAYTYDVFGNPASIKVSSGANVPAAGTGALSTSTDYALLDSRKTQTSYLTGDSNNGYFLQTVTNPLLQVTTYNTWDAASGQPTQVTAADGVVTTSSYDGLGRKLSQKVGHTKPVTLSYLSATTQCAPTAVYMVTMQQAGNTSKTSCYDLLGRVVQTFADGFDSTANDFYQTTKYDTAGRLASVSEPYSQTDYNSGQTFYTNYLSYDALNRVKEKTDAKGVDVKYTYDVNNDPLETKIVVTPPDSPAYTTYEVHNSPGKLLSSTDANGSETDFRYDPQGNPVLIQDAGGHQTLATYNVLGQKIAVSDPDQGDSTFAYDVLGELLQQTDAKNQQITIAYDDLGRMSSKLQPENTTPTTWTYDDCTNGVGKLCTVVQPARVGETTGYQANYTYDQDGRVFQDIETINGNDYETDTIYDDDGRVSTVNYPASVMDTAPAPPSVSASKTTMLVTDLAETLTGTSVNSNTNLAPQYRWVQTSSTCATCTTTFTQPTALTTGFLPSGPGIFTYELIADDGLLSTPSGTVTVTVQPTPSATMLSSWASGSYTVTTYSYDGTGSLEWGTSTDAASFLLYQSINGAAYTQVANCCSAGTPSGFGMGAPSFNLSGLGVSSQNNTYTFKADGYANSVASPDSPTTNVTVALPPGPPASATVQATSNWDGSFTVSWTKPASGVVTSYYVDVGYYYNDGGTRVWDDVASCTSTSSSPKVLIPPSPTKSCKVPGNKTTMPARSYSVLVSACNNPNGTGNCSSTSTSAGSVTVAYEVPPGAPTLAQPSEGPQGNVSLTWSAGSGTITKYVAYGNYFYTSGIGSTGPLVVCTTAPGIYACTDTPGTGFNSVQYYVQACNNAGCTSSGIKAVSLTGGGTGCKLTCNQTPQPAPAPTTSTAPSGASGGGAWVPVRAPDSMPALAPQGLDLPSSRLALLRNPTIPKRKGGRAFQFAPPVYQAYADARVEPASGTSIQVGASVTYLYNATGYLSQVVNGVDNNRVYWKATEVNARQQIRGETYGNGVQSTRDYFPDSGYVEDIQSGVGGGTGLQYLSYTWEKLGNLTQRDDQRQSLIETFGYDILNRVITAQVTAGSTAQPQVTYGYDNLGDILCKSDVTGGNCLGATPPQDYSYGQAGEYPHGVTSVQGTQNGTAFTNTYSYDADGNMISRVTTAGTTTLNWNSDNLPICMDSNGASCNETGAGVNYSQFFYAPDKHRYYQSAMVNGTQETTIYAGPLEIVTDGTGTHNRYNLSAYGKAIAIVDLETVSGNPVINDQYLLTDSLGSVDIATDANGAVVSNSGFSFETFGQRRDATTWQVPASGTAVTADRTTVTHKGFTGHEMLDNLNLVHMNGRVYDPTLGRFLSVDPVFQFPTNMQSLNPYSYVLNNPLSVTDPTGYAQSCTATSATGEGGTACQGTDDGKSNSSDNFKAGTSVTKTFHSSYTATGSHIAQSSTVTVTGVAQANGNVNVYAGSGPAENSGNGTKGQNDTDKPGTSGTDLHGPQATNQNANSSSSGQTQRLKYDDVKKLVHDNNLSGQSDQLITAMTWKESKFDPNAKSNDPDSTATGLMQVTKYADKDLVRLKGPGYSWDKITDPKDPAMNIRAGSLYLGLRIQWAGGDVTKGLEGYGTGKGYATSILKAEADLKLGPQNPQQILINDIGKP